MSSATARFISLLSTSLPLRHLHRYRPSLLFLSRSPPPRPSLHLPRRFHFNAHAQTPTNDQFNDYVPSASSANGAGGFSPWPEWYKLINSFQFSRYSGRLHGNLAFDKFVNDGASLPADFVRSATVCLEFARDHESLLWLLSRKDIEMVVENGAPFLFKDAADTMRRMKLFLYGSTDEVLGSEKPSTVDVMKFLLSYASTALASSETYRFNNRDILEESVRRLFNQLAETSGAPESTLPGSLPRQFPGTNGQLPNSSEQHIQMKRGDWICPRCSFMNFARNMKCLECEEARPKRELTGGEWECPYCDFFNFGRNSVCLRCDCKKPGISNPMAGSSHSNYANNESSHKQSGQNQERVQSWFHKISQLESMPNENNSSTDKAILENFPLKEGVISKTNTLNQVGNESLDFKISRRFDKILAQSTDGASGSASPSSDELPESMPIRKGENRFVVRAKEDRSLTSPLYKRRMAMEQSKSSNYVPFVPFPPNYFSKDQNPRKEESPAGNSYASDQSKVEPMLNQQTDCNAPGSQQADDQKPTGLWRGSSLEGSAVKEPDPLDMSEEAKAERWFRRVAQIKDIKELNEIPDEDFPSIMPMRKGVNRFVVSKRKTPLERRLASSQYRRNLPVVKSDPLKEDGTGSET